MKLVDIDRPVTSEWLLKEGRRFDAGPFLSGAVEARLLLEELDVTKEPLHTLTKGADGGIYYGGREKIRWVTSPEFGVPCIGSTDILLADLSNTRLISKVQVAKTPSLLIREGMTLITRSGSVGRTAYVRKDMDGMACQDVIRVVPDPDRIPPGYLYAYLSSKYGVPLVVSGTYGAIIQHIEPEHIANLPVPRLPKVTESKVHELIVRAASLRSSAAHERTRALALVEGELKWEPSASQSICSEAPSSCVQRRLDGFYNSAGPASGRSALANHPSATPLLELAQDVYETNRGARQKVDDPNCGVPFLSSSSVFRAEPEADYSVSRSTNDFERLQLQDKDLLLPRSGQVGGIIGRAVLPLSTCLGWLASEHLVRVRMPNAESAHIAFAIFASQPGYWATVGTAFGSSIPSLDSELLSELRIPWFTESIRKELAVLVGTMVRALSEAVVCDQEARRLVETALEARTSG